MRKATQRTPLRLIERKSPDYSFTPIAYHDSWLSVDPIIGCTSACSYCYMRQTGWTGVRPEKVIEVGELIVKLLASENKHFIPNETIISFGNHTDTFSPENVDYFRNLSHHR